MIETLDLAARLWGERDVALDAADLSLADVVRIDGQLDKALGVLDAAGAAGWEACAGTLRAGQPGHLFVAAALAFGAGHEERVETVLTAGFRSAALFRGVESALGWIELVPARTILERFLASSSPDLRRVAIAALAVQRVDPGPALDGAVEAEDTPLRARAVKAVWQVGRRDLVPRVREACVDPDVPTRFSACWGGALLARDPLAIAGLRRFAESGERYPDRAVQLAGLCAFPRDAREWQRTLPARLAILGTWSLSDPEDVPWLLDRMQDPALARVAGEAFTVITGAELTAAPAGPPADPADAGLPFPDPAAARAWWTRERSHFAPGVRHFLGKPHSAAVLQEILRGGRVRHRTVAATELALIDGGACFEVRAPGHRQLSALRRSSEGFR